MAESKGGDAKEQDPPTAVEGKEGEEGEEGAESGDFEQDTGTLKWTTHQCGGDVPSPRSGHSLSVLGGAAYLFGGMGEGGNRVDEDGVEIFGPTNEVFYCRLEASGSRNAMRWERCSTGGEAPLPRWGHTATVISKKEFVVIGGFHSDTNRFNDVHIFDTQKNMWIQPLETITDFTPRGNHISRKTGGAGAVPAPRGGHTTTMIGTSLVVFGGYGGMGYARRDFNDVAVFDVEAQDWVKMANIQGTAPEARSGHSASLHKDESIFYFGGWNA
jgi:dynein heavy chain